MPHHSLGIQLQVKTPDVSTVWTRFTAGLERTVARQPSLAHMAAWLHRAPTWESVAAVGAAALVIYMLLHMAVRLAASILKVMVVLAAVGAVYLFVIH